MAEAPSNNPTPTPPADPANPPAQDPNNPAPAADPKPNDPAPVTLTDEQLQAAFQHPRFKELAQQAKEAKELKAAQAQREEEEAKAKGEFEKLADQYKSEAQQAKDALATERANNSIFAEAVKAGITDMDAAVKLIDRGSIKINDDGSVEGVAEAVAKLVEAKPYLKSAAPAVNVGTPTNPDPNSPANPAAFTGSQIKDHKFYLEHQKDIDKAVDEGRVDWSK